MISSVGPEADLELTDGAVLYAREGSAELGFAFIAEFERALELLCAYPQLGALWRNRRRFRCVQHHLYIKPTNSAWLRSPITGSDLTTGPVENEIILASQMIRNIFVSCS